MNRGYVKIWRKLADNGLLSHADACQLFLFLMVKATHKPHKILVGSQVLTLEPGQFFTGRQWLARELGSTEKKVRTSLEVLRKTGIIDQQTTSKGSIISLINWSAYQDERPTEGQHLGQQRASRGPAEGQQRATKQTHNTETQEEEESPHTPLAGGESEGDPETRQPYTADFETLWSAYPRRSGKGQAWTSWQKLKRQKIFPGLEAMVKAIEAQARSPSWSDPKYIPHLSTWLNGHRWLDETNTAQQDSKKERNIKALQEWTPPRGNHEAY
jgi:hypothetical protein